MSPENKNTSNEKGKCTVAIIQKIQVLNFFWVSIMDQKYSQTEFTVKATLNHQTKI